MTEQAHRVPGVHREVVREAPDLVFRTGVPAFLGHSSATSPVVLTRAGQLATHVPGAAASGLLAAAVRGFFDRRRPPLRRPHRRPPPAVRRGRPPPTPSAASTTLERRRPRQPPPTCSPRSPTTSPPSPAAYADLVAVQLPSWSAAPPSTAASRCSTHRRARARRQGPRRPPCAPQ
jgi:hypothetical protein